MKKAISVFLAVVMLLTCLCTSAFAASDISVTVEGEAVVWTDAKPFIDANSRTLVPLRAVGDAMGLEVTWDAANRVASFSRTTSETDEYYGMIEVIQFPIDSDVALCEVYQVEGTEKWLYDSWEVEMDTAAVISDSRTYAPVRYLAEFFGYKVGWDNDTRTVTVDIVEYSCYYEFIGNAGPYIAFAFTPGEAYDEIERIEVTAATVNGKTAVVDVFDEAELESAREFTGADVFYGVYLRHEDFLMFEVEIPFTMTVKFYNTDGTTNEQIVEETFINYGMGGF